MLFKLDLLFTLTLSKRHDSRERIQEGLKDPKKDPPLDAISPNAIEAALRVDQSLLLRDSWMLDIAAESTFRVGAPPA